MGSRAAKTDAYIILDNSTASTRFNLSNVYSDGIIFFSDMDKKMFEISIKSHFCGAHFLAGYKGPCANLHGHNWEVELFMQGTATNRLGMLIDFKEVKKKLNAVLGKIDHKNLNDLPAFGKKQPTAENIAKFIFDNLSPKLNASNCRLDRVRISETPGTAAWYYDDEKSPLQANPPEKDK